MAIYERTRNGYCDIDDLNIGGCELKYKNFAGRPDDYHPDGGFRKFSVVIDDPVYAQELNEEGWNVRIKQKDDGEKPECIMDVKVSYRKYPPKIVVITSGKKHTDYTEDMIDKLDRARIVNADISIQPSLYNNHGRSGISAYLKSAYLTIEEDYWASKYEESDEDEMPF